MRPRGLTNAFAVAVGLALLGFFGIARADETFVDDFDDGWLDACSWLPASGEGVTVTETGGVLALSSEGGGHTQVSTIYAFVGDFDVQVDFQLLEFPAAYSCNAGLRVYSALSAAPSHDLVALKRWRTSTEDTYVMLKYVNGVYTEVGVPATTGDMSGRLRIERSGTLFHAYWWSGGWQLFASTSHFADPVWIILDTFGAGTSPTVSAAFDNLSVTAAGTTRSNDFDFDEDVDSLDFDAFGGCLAGPDEARSPLCALADSDCDDDVDLRDFAQFQLDFTGPL